MSFARFHPLVQQWFRTTLGEPTPAQASGWDGIAERRHTLIAAPTGSGKTLAAFLAAIDDLTREGLAGALPDEVRVVYISPLKALSADIHKNLAEPLRRDPGSSPAAAGLAAPRITVSRPHRRYERLGARGDAAARRRTFWSRRPSRSTCCSRPNAAG